MGTAEIGKIRVHIAAENPQVLHMAAIHCVLPPKLTSQLANSQSNDIFHP